MTAPVPTPTTSTDETSFGTYALYAAVGAGALALGYGAYRVAKDVAAPIALGLHAPELVPHYEAWRKAKTPEERTEHLKRAVEAAKEYGATSSASLPRIDQWRYDNDMFGHPEVRGIVFGKPGVADGTPIAVAMARVQGRYRLGTKATPEQVKNKVYGDVTA